MTVAFLDPIYPSTISPKDSFNHIDSSYGFCEL